MLTALHVMDELNKKHHIDTSPRNTRYSGAELPSIVTCVRLYDVLKVRWMLHPLGTASAMLVLPDARTGVDEPRSHRDIAAFRIDPRSALNFGDLAPKAPEPGEPVWLAARFEDGSRVRRAVCADNTASTFVFRYDEEKNMPRHTSGAPILDRHGAVVGINAGFGRFDRCEFGHANPLTSIRSHLEGALPEA